ncbi:hypothetical protein [Leptospira perdikensis]|uniref:Uncharacterized protein n=1 Tax=Leptospira perdikensis TaxID=2484948 RepID=A0A4R9JH01_9LEPT|nr:hypothetical protein [Leptospira perdikensis]TGL44156.1 hypothetical protein EHQ49_01340 [Leptospira perdikensis]
MKHFPLYILLLFFSFCERDDWRAEMEKENQKVISQIQKDHKLIEGYKANPKDWEQSSKTKELAVSNFLQEISKFGKPEKHYVTWNEKLSVLFPNIKGSGTMLDTTPLFEYKKMLEERETMALTELSKILLGKTFQINSIVWEKPRQYGSLMGYKPKSIQLKVEGKLVVIQQIKMIFQTNSGYKIGVLGP